MENSELARGVSNILSRVFRNDGVKRSVKEFSDRLNFACPYCRDSTTNRYKKRGNIFLESLTFHCFNCGAHESVWKFFNSFDEPLPEGVADRIAELRGEREKKAHKERNEVVDNDTFRLLDRVAMNREMFKGLYNLVEVEPDGKGAPMVEYLNSRHIPENRRANFLYKPLFNELYVLNLANNGCDVVGVQVRSFDPSKPKYRSQNIEYIYKNAALRLPCGDVDADTLDDLNKLSLVYNALNFNLYGKDIYVFEGGIDSFFLPNSLGQCGVKKDVRWLDSLSNVVYFFDNDDAGREQSAHKLKNGHRVFLWGKFLEENGFGCKPKDLNDFVTWCEGHGTDWCALDYSAYVGDNELDIIYL